MRTSGTPWRTPNRRQQTLKRAVQRWDIPQEEAAKRLGLTRPRTNDLLRGKLAKFSLDALVNIAASAHLDIEIRVKEVA